LYNPEDVFTFYGMQNNFQGALGGPKAWYRYFLLGSDFRAGTRDAILAGDCIVHEKICFAGLPKVTNHDTLS
jgi:hypothetical protein